MTRQERYDNSGGIWKVQLESSIEVVNTRTQLLLMSKDKSCIDKENVTPNRKY